MKCIAFNMTGRQLLDGSKTVTRRKGWEWLTRAQLPVRLLAVEDKPGIGRRELAIIEVWRARREYAFDVTESDCRDEGYPDMSPEDFVDFFCRTMRCQPCDHITVLEFRLVETFDRGTPRDTRQMEMWPT